MSCIYIYVCTYICRYVKGNERSSIHWFAARMFASAKAGQGQIQKPETVARSPIWVERTNVLVPLAAVCQSAQQQEGRPEAEGILQRRHSPNGM